MTHLPPLSLLQSPLLLTPTTDVWDPHDRVAFNLRAHRQFPSPSRLVPIGDLHGDLPKSLSAPPRADVRWHDLWKTRWAHQAFIEVQLCRRDTTRNELDALEITPPSVPSTPLARYTLATPRAGGHAAQLRPHPAPSPHASFHLAPSRFAVGGGEAV
jgi:hypothetical protein